MEDPRLPDPPVSDETDDDVSIAQSLARVAVAMHDLTEQLAANEPKINRIERRSFWSILMSAALVLCGALLMISTVMNYTIVSYIRDCTDPAGKCYIDSRARTAGVEQRVLSAQRADADRTLRAVCAVFDEHELERPPECGPR